MLRPTPSLGPAVSHEGSRLPTLDGLRGIAILAVLVYHFWGLAVVDSGSVGPAIDRIIATAVRSGWIGVDLFFVLSGFLITGILVDAKLAAHHFFRNFYARRTLRIFPAYYLFLVLLFLLYPVLQSQEPAAIDAIESGRLWFLGYLVNVRYALDDARRADIGITGPLWSLSVEEQFYLVWPAIVLLLNRRKLLITSGAAILGALVLRTTLYFNGANPWWGYTMMPARMDALAAGAILAIAFREEWAFHFVKRWLPPIALACACTVFAFALWSGRLNPFDPWMRTGGYTALAIVFAGMLFVALMSGSDLMHRTLTSTSLQTLGKFSYAMYIVHAAIAWTIFRRLNIGESVPSIAGSHLPGEFAFLFVAFVATFAIALLSWNLLEKQFLKLKVHFPYADQGGSAAIKADEPALGGKG